MDRLQGDFRGEMLRFFLKKKADSCEPESGAVRPQSTGALHYITSSQRAKNFTENNEDESGHE